MTLLQADFRSAYIVILSPILHLFCSLIVSSPFYCHCSVSLHLATLKCDQTSISSEQSQSMICHLDASVLICQNLQQYSGVFDFTDSNIATFSRFFDSIRSNTFRPNHNTFTSIESKFETVFSFFFSDQPNQPLQLLVSFYQPFQLLDCASVFGVLQDYLQSWHHLVSVVKPPCNSSQLLLIYH